MPDNVTTARSILSERFYRELEDLLRQSPQGMTEFELLQALRKRDCFPFISKRPAQALELFHAHFLLFHALYRLQKTQLENHTGILEISALSIRLHGYRPGRAAMMVPDQVRDYYLDLENLAAMTDSGAAELLQSFWQEFVCYDNRAAALQELGLSDPVGEATIKQTYRRLAMTHHPDRGGEPGRLQAINAAYRWLCKPRT